MFKGSTVPKTTILTAGTAFEKSYVPCTLVGNKIIVESTVVLFTDFPARVDALDQSPPHSHVSAWPSHATDLLQLVATRAQSTVFHVEVVNFPMSEIAPASSPLPKTHGTLPFAGYAALNIRPQRRLLDDNRGVDPVARVLLAGALLPSNKNSPFSELSKCLHLVEEIYCIVRASWKDDLIIGPPSFGYWFPEQYLDPEQVGEMCRTSSVAHIGNVIFPPPRGININMMPIEISPTRISGIPMEYEHYRDIIEKCCFFQYTTYKYNFPDDDRFKSIAYLTIHESRVENEQWQRRPGIHTEVFFSYAPRVDWHDWGQFNGASGGIFSASTVSGSSRIWNAKIPRVPNSALQEGCDIEHLRAVLNENAEWVEPEAGEVYWMTDSTPHKSLPLKAGTYRQYFRLVTGYVSVWWEM